MLDRRSGLMITVAAVAAVGVVSVTVRGHRHRLSSVRVAEDPGASPICRASGQ